MEYSELNLLAGWIAMLCGVLAGALSGLFFHREDWLGGYGSFRRRLVRLGHIAFFGLGFLNAFFVFTLRSVSFPASHVAVGAVSLLIGTATMPLCCYLVAWKHELRFFFAIPVLSVLTAIVALLAGWPV